MTEKKCITAQKLTDDEIRIIDAFRKIPEDKQNEALINLYILAENSQIKNNS